DQNLSVRLFFSSRRRHTRSKRDWSSDVCSSDLFSKISGQSLQTDQITRPLFHRHTVYLNAALSLVASLPALYHTLSHGAVSQFPGHHSIKTPQISESRQDAYFVLFLFFVTAEWNARSHQLTSSLRFDSPMCLLHHF